MALVGIALIGWGVLRLSGSSRYSSETVDLREMRQSSLTELVTDLHAKPNVNSIITGNAEEGAAAARMYLPPDRSYEAITLIVALKDGTGTPSESVLLIVIDCTSPERAELLVERWKASMAKEVRLRWSGRFVVFGDDAGINWLGRHYLLRGTDPPARPTSPDPPPKFVPKAPAPKPPSPTPPFVP